MEANFRSLEKWIKKRLTKIEMKFFITTASYTLFDHKRNEDILEELKEEPADDTLKMI